MVEPSPAFDDFSADGLPAVWYTLDETSVLPRVVGGSPADVLGPETSASDALVRHIHHADRGRVLATRLTTLHDRRSARITYRIQVPGRVTRSVLELMKVTRHEEAPQLVGLVIDMTAEHRAFEWVDRSLRLAEDRIEHLNRLDQARTTFIRLFVHDLDPTIRAARSGLEMVESGDISPGVVDSLRTALTELAGLVEDVLDLNRFDGTTASRTEPVDLADVARSMLFARRSSRIVAQLHPSMILGDAALLQRVVDNLLRNALIHTSADTSITIRTWRDDGGVCLEVADTGPGIPAQRVEEIFEPLIRLGSPDTPGFGMGLSLVRRVVEMHGGTCRVVETPGGGATFRVELPAADATASTRASAGSADDARDLAALGRQDH